MCNNGTHDHDQSEDHGHYTVSGATPDRSALGNQSTVHTGDQSIVDVNTFDSSYEIHDEESFKSPTPGNKFNTNTGCQKLIQKKDNSEHTNSENSDVFVGVTYKRNARYYLSGIGRRSSKEGILNYIEQKGATVSHFILFKPKSPRARLTAKVNVALRDADLIESDNFWPDGVQCRRWYSVRQWEEMCSNRNTQYEDWDIDNDKVYE